MHPEHKLIDTGSLVAHLVLSLQEDAGRQQEGVVLLLARIVNIAEQGLSRQRQGRTTCMALAVTRRPNASSSSRISRTSFALPAYPALARPAAVAPASLRNGAVDSAGCNQRGIAASAEEKAVQQD